MRVSILVFAFLLAALAAPNAGFADDGPLTVFLTRHAEKADASRDAELAEAGLKRADDLAKVLRDAEIEQVHSTDFRRTRATAGPTAAAFDTEVALYDPQDLQALVDKLLEAGGRHLVVGHTRTLPRTIELLGGDPGFPIDEEGEFDRLYIVTVGSEGEASTVLLRYGEIWEGGF